MLDPNIVRENPDLVKEALKNRNYPLSFLEKYIEADKNWRTALQEVEILKQKRNQLSPKGKPTPDELKKLTEISSMIKKKHENLLKLEQKALKDALFIPNIPNKDVPIGNDEAHNLEIKKSKAPPAFTFTPKPHDEIALALDIIDFERAGKITGSRFSVLKGWGAKLERALINFMLDAQTNENGYQEIFPPTLINTQSLEGTGQLPKFIDDQYKIKDHDLWLSPTAEVQLTNLYQNEILEEENLPLKLTAHTQCFRKEAGSYGKDIKGLIRQHQFNKIELVKIVQPENSAQELESLLLDAESILQKLELPYRVITLCTGDLGFSAAKTYDLEVWFPSQNKYREISSCSNFLDFQARRAMIRYRNKSKGTAYAHTLNGSGLAVGRTFAAILENYQNKNGSVKVPKVLIPYIGTEEIS